MASSLRLHPGISMRQNTDKEMDVVDLDQLFGQYVETGLLQQYSGTTAEPSSSDDLARLFELHSSNGTDHFESSPMPNWDASTEDAWHKAIHKIEQNPASPTVPDSSLPVYPDSNGNASMSDPELLSFDDLFASEKNQLRSRSQPSTPKPTPSTPRPTKKSTANADKSIRHGIHKLPKKSSFSSINAKMMRPSHYRAPFSDIWSQHKTDHTDTFNLQLPPNGIYSPPPSSKLMQGENSNTFSQRDHQSYTLSMSPLTGDETATPDISHSNYQLTPLSSPAIDISNQNSSRNSFQFSTDNMATGYISHMSNAALSALQTPPSSHRLPMNTWGSDASPNLDFSFSASPNFSSSNKTSGWWGNAAATVPVSQPNASPPTSYQDAHSSRSQSVSFNSSSVAGLGISCDTASFGSFAPDLVGNTSLSGLHSSASSFDTSGYNTSMYSAAPPTPAPIPHQQHQHQTPGIHIGQPQPTRRSSNSPSLSPEPQPHFTRRRHSTHRDLHRSSVVSSSSRRKSSHASTLSSSTSRSGSGSGSSGSVGFVNFTPDDSRKILTGVAPSGSSKTKARREKEAAERRRKLSQAAVKAVMEAGGDIGRLEKEGLLVLEG